MWPFTRRPRGVQVDLGYLARHQVTDLVTKYVNLLMIDIAQGTRQTVTLRADEPLPALSPAWNQPVDPRPTYAEAITRIRHLLTEDRSGGASPCGAGPVQLFVGSVGAVNLHVSFGSDDATVTVAVERLGASWPVRS